ncbi:MAG: glycosyltransferase family 2 protein [Chloroflexota bacterium]
MMSTTAHPFVSLLLPIRNEARYIQRCLNAVLAQDYPPDRLEILIADGMSTDGTRDIIQQVIKKHNKIIREHSSHSLQKKNTFPNIQLIDNPQQIVPTGLNLGLQHARGEIIIRVDGHTVIAPDYVRQCVDALARSGADNVGGRMNAVGENAFGRAVALATSSPFGVGGARFHYSDKEEWGDTVYMGAWPRSVFDAIGPFDEELVRDQDDEFNYRLRAAGGKILLSPRIKSEYTVRGAPRALWRQYFQYGYWKVRVLQKHPRQMRPRQFIPPLFVLALLLSLLLAPFPIHNLQFTINHSQLTIHPSLLIPSLYLLATLTASLYTTIRPTTTRPTTIRLAIIGLLPLTYAILHLSYGLGFLVGLVKFWNRWGDKRGKTPLRSSEVI